MAGRLKLLVMPRTALRSVSSSRAGAALSVTTLLPNGCALECELERPPPPSSMRGRLCAWGRRRLSRLLCDSSRCADSSPAVAGKGGGSD